MRMEEMVNLARVRYEGKWDSFDRAVYEALSELGPCTARRVARELGEDVKVQSVACALVRLEARGKVWKVSRRQDVYTWETVENVGSCSKCWEQITEWHISFRNGKVLMCHECFREYEKTHPVINECNPSVTMNGGTLAFYEWRDLKTFLKDHPGEYVWGRGYIIAKNHGGITWTVRNRSIMNEVMDGLPAEDEVA